MAERDRTIQTEPNIPKEVLEAGVESKGVGWGGISREYQQVKEMLVAFESLPKDEAWGENDFSAVALAMFRDVDVYNSIFGMERLPYYPASSAVALTSEIDGAVTDVRDGRGFGEAKVLVKNAQKVEKLKEDAFNARITKENLSLGRRIYQTGFYESRDNNGKVIERIRVTEDEKMDWLIGVAKANQDIRDSESELRLAVGDEKVQSARDFFTLTGFSPENIAKVEEVFDIGEKTNMSEEDREKWVEVYGSRETFAYWMQVAARGINSLVDFFPFVVKETADLESSMNLLTKEWVPKPPNTEMFGVLRSKNLDLGVTEVFKALLQMDIMETETKKLQKKTVEGKDIEIDVQEVKKQEADFVEFWKGNDVFGVGKKGEVRSIFNLHCKPEERRDWLSRMGRFVESKLREKEEKGEKVVKRPAAWARVSVPIALAFYEILLLGQRGAVRRDKEGKTIKVAKERVIDVGNNITEKRVVTDFYGNVVFEDEENGPGTMTGWFADLEEKALRTKSRFMNQGGSGYASPSALAVFGSSDRYLRVMFEKKDSKGMFVNESRLDAVRNGRVSVGDCFKEMPERARAFEALNLFRAVSMIEGIPNTPFAILDNVLSERQADDKFIGETVKYFKGMTKALGMIYFGQPEQIARAQVNLLSLIVRRGKRSDAAEGGSITRGDEKISFGAWFDQTFVVLKNALCGEAPIIHSAHFDLAVRMGKKDKSKETVRGEKVMYNDRVGVILEEDLIRNQELKRLLSLKFSDNKANNFALTSSYGPDGNVAIGDMRDKYLNSVLNDIGSSKWV